MKFKTLLTVAALILMPIASQASTKVEELCYSFARTQARLHSAIQDDPDLRGWISRVDQSGGDEKTNKSFKEMVYYSFNRISMSSEDIRKLSFINCYSKFM